MLYIATLKKKNRLNDNFLDFFENILDFITNFIIKMSKNLLTA